MLMVAMKLAKSCCGRAPFDAEKRPPPGARQLYWRRTMYTIVIVCLSFIAGFAACVSLLLPIDVNDFDYWNIRDAQTGWPRKNP